MRGSNTKVLEPLFNTLARDMTSIRQFGLLLLGVLFAVVSLADEPNGYRLSGTINAGEKGWFAVLELPDGEQLLLNKGDSIPGGQVLDIGDAWLTLRDAQGELTLGLESGEREAAFGELPSPFINLQASESLRDALNELGQTANDEQQLALGISELLKISAKGRVASIDDSPVSSAKHSLALLKRSLSADHPVRIAVTGIEGFDAVYLTPAPLPDDINQQDGL